MIAAMRPRPLILVLAFFLTLSGLARGAENWSQLKLGMTSDETVAKLGRPMFRTSGNGFELWNYDNGSEVLLFGSLVGWTVPRTSNAVLRSTDIWQANSSKTYLPTFLSLFPQAVPKLSARQRAPRHSQRQQEHIELAVG